MQSRIKLRTSFINCFALATLFIIIRLLRENDGYNESTESETFTERMQTHTHVCIHCKEIYMLCERLFLGMFVTVFVAVSYQCNTFLKHDPVTFPFSIKMNT